MTKAEQVTGACAEHSEGPFWDAAGGRLLFVDLERGAVLAMTDGGTLDCYEFGGVTAAIRAAPGRLPARHEARLPAAGLGILRCYADAVCGR